MEQFRTNHNVVQLGAHPHNTDLHGHQPNGIKPPTTTQPVPLKGAQKNAVPKKSQADILLEIAQRETKVFRNDRDEIFATVEQGSQLINLRIRSVAFRSWLNVRHLEIYGRVANSKGAFDTVISVLDGYARRTAHQEIFTRIATTDDAIFYDLADERGQAVKITAQGWDIVTRAPVAFYRPKGMRAQVAPIRGGNIADLKAVLNIKEDDFPLVAAFLIGYFQPRGPRAHMGIIAEQGSGKSKQTEFFRRILDPNAVPTRKEPKDARDLAIAAKSNSLLAFDNLSYIPQWLSDFLCCLATGAGFATRALYFDDEEEIFSAQRPVIFNAITAVATRPDLLDRTILLELPRVPEDKRKDEQELEAIFQEKMPSILGALFDAVAIGLRDLSSIHVEKLPRMADFAKWIMACAPGMGMSAAQFTKAYERNRETITDLVAEISTLQPVFEDWARAQKVLEKQKDVVFCDTATELLASLNKFASAEIQKSPEWPRSSRALGRELSRLTPNLRARGWDVGPGKKDSNRAVKIRKTAQMGENGPSNGPNNGPDSLASTSQREMEPLEPGHQAVISADIPLSFDDIEKEEGKRREKECTGKKRPDGSNGFEPYTALVLTEEGDLV
ncbi:hypothetical protein IAD21_02424 [Abditibacteriota bacterium]|nr:hypothetical protein IAD21_02424 [Abditibacteriota bacterium]